jgi:uncharacterized protein
MPPLSPIELRVLGALVEKQIATPDYYPLTLNALVNACNQKNHRDPVVTYDEAPVLRALETLRLKGLAFIFAGADARVRKYGHTFAKALALDPAETAVLCVLLLRGPQTPGELRSRTAHLHNFPTLDPVEETLTRLTHRPEFSETSVSEVSPSEALAKEGTTTALAKEGAPLVRKLPRSPGTKESRYTHLLGADLPTETSAETAATSETEVSPTEPTETSAEEVSSFEALAHKDEASPKEDALKHTDRLTHLETQITHLQQQLTDLQTQFATFRKQFE